MFETFNPDAMLTAWAFSPWLDGSYVVALIAAGGLLTISTLFGGDADADIDADFDAGLDVDADVDLDMDVDVDVDADLGADIDADGLHGDAPVGELDAHGIDGLLSLSSWISFRFFIYFAAMYGFVGTTMTYLSDMSEGRILLASLGSGLVVGQIAHQIFRYIKRTSNDSSTSPKDYVKKLARVTIAIQPPAVGEVAIKVGNGERYIRAAAKRDDDAFNAGDTVGVVALRAGTLIVVSQKEYQFLTASMKKKGGTQ